MGCQLIEREEDLSRFDRDSRVDAIVTEDSKQKIFEII